MKRTASVLQKGEGLDAADVWLGIRLEGIGAEGAAKGDHVIAMRDAGEPVTGGDQLFTHRTLDRIGIGIGGVKVYKPFAVSKVSGPISAHPG